jgi:hypothetical protein|uniref:Uncharacterized protein n=1 Tax=Fagus sylvatica TaxID=28930 RepID=A0A2N9HB17_FAGSY
MELKLGSMVIPKQVFQHVRARNHKNSRTNILENVVNVNGGGVVSCYEEDGVVRMKIIVKKQDLTQMLEVMGGGGKNKAHHQPSITPSLSAEQRLNLLQKKHLLRANTTKESWSSSWSPALQSIPEEL